VDLLGPLPLSHCWIVAQQLAGFPIFKQEGVVAFKVSVVNGDHQPFQGVRQGLGRSEGVVFGHGLGFYKCMEIASNRNKTGDEYFFCYKVAQIRKSRCTFDIQTNHKASKP
jgi:hypothetical protein